MLDPDRIATAALVDEALFVALRIRQSPDAKASLPLAEAMLTRARAGLAVEDKLAERLIEAEAGISFRNIDLDFAVAEHRGVVVRKTHGKTDHKLYQRFYATLKPHEIIRLGLRQELLVVEPWVESLKHDPDKELQDLGLQIEQVVRAGQAAVATHNDAIQAMRDFRADKRAKLFDDLNAGRRTLWAELSNLGRGPDFAPSFFRQSAKRTQRDALTVLEAEAQVAEAEALLKSAQAGLATAQAHAAEEAAALAAQKEAAAALAVAEAEAQALAHRIASLRQQSHPARL
jgi:hypothetical protein